MAKKLYVGNLSYEVSEDELTQLFSQCGQVIGARIVKDRETGRSKGFGFVEMPNDEEARHAIDRMQGHDLKGRPLKVDEAKENSPRQALAGNSGSRGPSRGGWGGGGYNSSRKGSGDRPTQGERKGRSDRFGRGDRGDY
jgi:RNA recognition motif-containing protein